MPPAPSSTIPATGLRWTADTGAIRFGWVNVVVAAVVMLATLPGRTQGLGLITEPLLHDLQLDRITYANINLWATLLGAAICLPIGRVFDRTRQCSGSWRRASCCWVLPRCASHCRTNRNGTP
jgi:hypothetical protein